MDKALHFLVGMAISGLSPTADAGLVLSITSGIAKEVYDRRHGGKFDIKDAIATGLGGGLVFTWRF